MTTTLEDIDSMIEREIAKARRALREQRSAISESLLAGNTLSSFDSDELWEREATARIWLDVERIADDDDDTLLDGLRTIRDELIERAWKGYDHGMSSSASANAISAAKRSASRTFVDFANSALQYADTLKQQS